jgi:Flp pilus assembly protein TadD
MRMSTIGQRLAQAIQLHQAGRGAEAEALYRGILQESPRQPDALHLLGILAHQAGRHQEAIDLISRALALRGPDAIFQSNLAAAYLEVDRLVEAVAHAREALRLNPSLPGAHNNLGVALRRQGQLAEAEACFREALRLQPNYVEALTNLGATLHQQGKPADALPLLQDAVRRAPNFAQAHNDLGAVLIALSQHAPAEQHLRRAVQLRPAFVGAHTNLGVALAALERVDEAMECFREALRLDPGHVAARNTLGFALEARGQLDEAVAQYRETLRYEPSNPVALTHLINLAGVGRCQLRSDEVGAIQTLAEHPELPAELRKGIHHALARYVDKTGDPEVAFAHARLANDLRKEALRQAGVEFDPARNARYVDRLIAVFGPAYFERVHGFGLESELPVFIVGMMRSGTTLVEQILASHPQIYGAGELKDFPGMVSTLPTRLGTTEEYPECMPRLDAAPARALAEGHLHRLHQLGGSPARVVDKMPTNFFHLGLIATLFPRARVIHCCRNPVDTCLSCYLQNFAEPHPFTLDLRHLGLYFRQYERLMAHWTNVLPLPIFEVQYEELTADQEGVSRKLIAFCGLEWDERCLRFHDTQRVVRTSSILQVRQPIYRSSVGRWKRYEKHLGPLLEALAE